MVRSRTANEKARWWWSNAESQAWPHAWRLLVRYSVRLRCRLNSNWKRLEIFGGLDGPWWEKGCFAAPWVELRRLLSCLSLSPLIRKEAYTRDAEDEQLTFLWRLVDISDSATTMTSPKPGDDNFTNNNLSGLHLFRLLVNEPISYNHVQGDDMRDSNPTFSCLARVAIPCQVQQPETAPLSGPKRSSFPLLFLLLIIEEQRWNLEQQVSEV